MALNLVRDVLLALVELLHVVGDDGAVACGVHDAGCRVSFLDFVLCKSLRVVDVVKP